jgi:hypothetical protein
MRSLKKGKPFSLRRDMKWLKTASKLLYILDACWSFHFGDGGDLVGIGLYASCADNVAQEYIGWNSKDAL